MLKIGEFIGINILLHPSHSSQATRRPNQEGQPEYTQELTQ